MKIQMMKTMITVGLLMCLAGTGIVTAAAGTSVADPRAARMATAIAYAMSGQQAPSEGLPAVKNTAALEALGGTIADMDFYPAGAFVQTFVIEKAQGRLSGLIYHRDGLSRVIMTRFAATFQEGRQTDHNGRGSDPGICPYAPDRTVFRSDDRVQRPFF